MGIDTEVVQLILVAGLLPLAGTLTYWYRDDVVCADTDMLAANSSAVAVEIHKARAIPFCCRAFIDCFPFLSTDMKYENSTIFIDSGLN
jgi:hypothetical protein